MGSHRRGIASTTICERRCEVRTFFAAVFLASSFSCATTPTPKSERDILVIGHRGASGHRPEHTLASYELAIQMGADYIEPDLVMTKDGVLIARHENEISGTTDVASKFPKRKKTKTIDGVSTTGWFTEDFTLPEIRTLKAKERLPTRDRSRDGQFGIPTFDEVLALAREQSKKSGRTIGVYPETKHPTYFDSIGLSLEPALVAALERVGWTKADDPVIIQSFELGALRKLREKLGSKLVFLLGDATEKPFDGVVAKDTRTYGDFTKPTELKNLAEFLYGIGPYKRLIVPADSAGRLLPATTLVKDAHAAGLKVHPYTFRSDPPHLAADYDGDPTKEYQQFFELGVDGVFSDFPDHAIQAREL